MIVILAVTVSNESTGLDGFCRRVRHFFYIIKASTTTKLNGVIRNFGRYYFKCKKSWVIFM